MPQWACQFMSPIILKPSRFIFFSASTLGLKMM